MSILEVISPSKWRTIAWRNGLGVSQHIWPQTDGMPGLLLNRTPIAQSGPFSIYDGQDRLLFVISGTLQLDIAGDVRTLAEREWIVFKGEDFVSATIISGQVEVLNLIVDSSRWEFSYRTIDEDQDHFANAPTILTHIVSGVAETLEEPQLGAGYTAISSEAFSCRLRSGWGISIMIFPKA